MANTYHVWHGLLFILLYFAYHCYYVFIFMDFPQDFAQDKGLDLSKAGDSDNIYPGRGDGFTQSAATEEADDGRTKGAMRFAQSGGFTQSEQRERCSDEICPKGGDEISQNARRGENQKLSKKKNGAIV